MNGKNNRAIVVIIGILSAIASTAYNYFTLGYENVFGMGKQLSWHLWIINDTAYQPNCWRVLVPQITETLNKLVGCYGWTFLILRFAFTFLVFMLLYGYVRKLKCSFETGITSIILFQFAIIFGVFHSDLTLNTILEIACFLTGLLIVILGWRLWLFIPLAIFSTFNRETAIFLPLLILVREERGKWWWCLLAMLSSGVVFYFLYHAHQYNQMTNAFKGGIIEMWKYNIPNVLTYLQYWFILGFLPVLAWLKWRRRRIFNFWLIFSIGWILFHFCFARLEEGRFFWIPLAMLLPMAIEPKKEVV